MEPIENESQNLRNFVELADQEALAGVFVVHLAAELLDALGMTISLISETSMQEIQKMKTVKRRAGELADGGGNNQ